MRIPWKLEESGSHQHGCGNSCETSVLHPFHHVLSVPAQENICICETLNMHVVIWSLQPHNFSRWIRIERIFRGVSLNFPLFDYCILLRSANWAMICSFRQWIPHRKRMRVLPSEAWQQKRCREHFTRAVGKMGMSWSHDCHDTFCRHLGHHDHDLMPLWSIVRQLWGSGFSRLCLGRQRSCRFGGGAPSIHRGPLISLICWCWSPWMQCKPLQDLKVTQPFSPSGTAMLFVPEASRDTNIQWDSTFKSYNLIQIYPRYQ